jgi:hypothetical protein
MRILLAALLTLCGLLFVVPDATAQVTSKAYAPENLSQLSVPDRIRVIELEYSEQSRGRRIPDDQLQFYLDQIRQSRWDFSRIKSDIATSLRGNAGGGGGSGGGWGGGGWQPSPGEREVTCESKDSRYIECATGFRGDARLQRQLSSTRCTEGSTWGSRPGQIWVRNGCRGVFVEDDRYTPPPVGAGVTVTCESRDGRYRECRTPIAATARLSQTLSSTPCVEGRSWGRVAGAIWVNNGCRARFVQGQNWGGGGGGGGGNTGYNVSCSSDDGRYKTCAWSGRMGRPVLIEQQSNTACIEGRTWGYDPREGLWVDRGCRGRFGSR